jgi:hypothetical protein
MAIADYEYTIEQCDVPEARRGALHEFRVFRRKCLEYMRGDSETSVVNQVHELAWDTAAFRTLNEARRIEPDREPNGATWELLTKGYAGIMTQGVRRLIDRDPRTDSVWNVITELEKRPELLTRENFVCHDGLPYDYAEVQAESLRSLGQRGERRRALGINEGAESLVILGVAAQRVRFARRESSKATTPRQDCPRSIRRDESEA